MAIPNPFENGAKAVKKVPPKVWLIAIGGGGAIYLIYRGHNANAASANAAAADATGTVDPSGLASSPTQDPSSLPGVYPIGGGQGAATGSLPPVDFGSAGNDPLQGDMQASVTSPGASDSVNPNGSGMLTLNIVTSNPSAVSTKKKPTKTAKAVAPKKSVRKKPVAGGGMRKREHPSNVHGNPKRPIKRGSPAVHTQNAPTSHIPAAPPHPPTQKRKAAPKKKAKVRTKKFAMPPKLIKSKGGKLPFPY